MASVQNQSPAYQWEPKDQHAPPKKRRPENVFVELIQRDPEICNSCFRHNRHVILPHSHAAERAKGLVRFYVPAMDTTRPVPEAGTEGQNPPRACKCGSLHDTQRPLAKDDAVEVAWELSAQLMRKRIPHDPHLLVAAVAHRKRLPKWGGRDDDNFRLAVEQAHSRSSFSYQDLQQIPDPPSQREPKHGDDGRAFVDADGTPRCPDCHCYAPWTVSGYSCLFCGWNEMPALPPSDDA
ncbi:hypothetical protein [Haladaptatus cibarius]|uniref:hypothetical protein n=1 Tax=Haladaptatus cibarius TaxID=453847 RepID=UPI000678A456|nr:hypothetical protein [Haladaptatus cibarius]